MLSAPGTRTRVARVRAEYPDQLDFCGDSEFQKLFFRSHHQVSSLQAREEASCFARQALYDARCGALSHRLRPLGQTVLEGSNAHAASCETSPT